mgnify:CR=1 FL=1
MLKADNLTLRKSRFAMTDYNRENPKDVDFTKLNAHLKNFKIKGPNVYAAIKEMSFQDHRGLFVENLISDFTYTKKNIKLENLSVKTKNSFLKGKTILSYNRKDFSNFNNKVIFDVEIDSSTLSTNDIRYFYAELGKNRTFALKSKVKGTLNDFYATNPSNSSYQIDFKVTLSDEKREKFKNFNSELLESFHGICIGFRDWWGLILIDC